MIIGYIIEVLHITRSTSLVVTLHITDVAVVILKQMCSFIALDKSPFFFIQKGTHPSSHLGEEKWQRSLFPA